ncbi:metallophosphoesterase [Chlorella sorokiniana]|uniref:Metallophosphoesterase n=1 Tax=Chlorella sorokiniana TaxID=3076 RepID=A0A2P6TXL9_CHLSO|nr:metallophosphoesterase [Chlorella sorokiniana]|eukprot:PRW58812.1 metallophosphoesterase [Chlorella sorokiniana]
MRLLLLACLLAAAAEAVAPPPPLPLAFVHLSDIHYSTNVRKYWRLFGDREGDAALWAQQVVPRLRPAAALVTGDITDSKTAHGEGLQQEVEWLAYASLLRNLSAAGVPEQLVWDVPGNHDTFNMPVRGGPNDFFATHSAEGKRRASHQQRVYLHQLPAPPGQQQQQGSDGSGSDGSSAVNCPAAWFLGLDPTPEPGLRSPTNFAGLARPAFLAEVRATLQSIEPPAGCGPPLIIAYCHYPLSTIDSTEPHSLGPAAILLHAAHKATAMQGLTQLLAEHNVAAVLSGHLHSSFGQRLHRVHSTPAGGHMAELETAAWKDDRRFRVLALDGGALSFVELMFHTRNAPRMPGRSDAPAMQDAAWQAAYERRGWAVTALDPSAAVIDHVALITSPPDGRYSSLGAPKPAAPKQRRQPQRQLGEGEEGSGSDGAEEEQEQQGWVRALVFSLDTPAAEQPAEQLEVRLSGWLPNGVQLFSKPMQLQQPAGSGGSGNSGSDGGLLFAAQGETTVSCVGAAGDPAAHCHAPADLVDIQVSVRGRSGAVSRSARQPAALRCTALTTSHQRCWVAPVEGRPLPLKVTALEWAGLAFNWPVMVHRLFLCAWLFQVGALLVAPRLLASRVQPLIAASPLLQCRASDQLQLPSTPRSAAASGGVAAAAQTLVATAVSYLLWPVAALFISASVTGVWAAQLAFSLYLLLGPWLLYTGLSPGYPPAVMFHFGVLGRLDPSAPASWRFISTCDTMFVSLLHLLLCVLPATLWVACVVARRCQLAHHASPGAVSRSGSRSSSEGSTCGRRRLESGGEASYRSLLREGNCLADGSAAGRWAFSVPQLAALAALAALNWAGVYYKAASLMGAISLLASPGFAWTLPLALLLVVAWPGPRRAGSTQKGE